VSARPGKSDEIDARAIARAVVKDGIEDFPAAHLDEQAMEIRLLSDHRKDLVAERTRVQNRLRWHLLELCGDLEQSLRRGALERPQQLDRIDRRLRRLPAGARVRVAREQIAHLRVLTRQADALERELLELVKAHRPQLLAERGCGALTAAILIGRTAGAERFPSDASFARLAGTAPIPCSSGQRDRHRLDRGGDRQLNYALHVIAITRARYDPATKAYLARKEAETKKGALRCLKRHLARHFIICSQCQSRHLRTTITTAPRSRRSPPLTATGSSTTPLPPSCHASDEIPTTSVNRLTYRDENPFCRAAVFLSGGAPSASLVPGALGLGGRTQTGQAAICSLG
jgi:transposase